MSFAAAKSTIFISVEISLIDEDMQIKMNLAELKFLKCMVFVCFQIKVATLDVNTESAK